MKKAYFFIVLACLILNCSPLEQPKHIKYNETKLILGTVVEVDVCYKGNDQNKLSSVYKLVWRRLEDIHQRMNAYDNKSDVAKINNSSTTVVPVHAEVYQLVKKASHYSEITRGTFDITVGPLVDLWKSQEAINTYPEENILDAFLKKVGMDNIDFQKENSIRLLNPQTKIDLGGIAKGYAVDEAARILAQNGFPDFLINAGGDLRAGGRNCQGDLWHIGIRDPRDTSKIIEVLNVTNAAVTTSGDYEQFFEIQGQKWSHIINPITGYPQKDVISATVIAKSAEEADALSTAFCVLGGQDSLEVVDNLQSDIEAIIIEQKESGDLKIYKTKGYDNYISSQQTKMPE